MTLHSHVASTLTLQLHNTGTVCYMPTKLNLSRLQGMFWITAQQNVLQMRSFSISKTVKVNPKKCVYLDGYEVSLAFISNGFGQQSFTASRGSVEQNPLGRGHAKLKELLWMLHRVLR